MTGQSVLQMPLAICWESCTISPPSKTQVSRSGHDCLPHVQPTARSTISCMPDREVKGCIVHCMHIFWDHQGQCGSADGSLCWAPVHRPQVPAPPEPALRQASAQLHGDILGVCRNPDQSHSTPDWNVQPRAAPLPHRCPAACCMLPVEHSCD